VPGTGTVDEATMRRIVREEAKAAASEAVENFLFSKVLLLGSAAAGLMKGGQTVCSFCGSTASQVKKMVGSAHGIHMCDRCVGAAHQHLQTSAAK
jgi:ClpX C4-type zinc finger protein